MITLISGGKTRRNICHGWREKENNFFIISYESHRLPRQIRIPRPFSYIVCLQLLINPHQKVRRSSGGREGKLEEICQSIPNFQPAKSGSGAGGLSKTLPGIPSLHRELGDYPTKDKKRSNKATMLKNSYKCN